MFSETTLQRVLIFLFRVSIGWVFLGAGIRQVPDSSWSAAGFISNAPNLTWFYQAMAEPPFITVINFVVPWAHLLLGLALILGIAMRLAAVGGAALMILYYIPRFEFPGFVEYHLVYAGLIVYLAAVGAGRIYGLENWVRNSSPLAPFLERHPLLRKAIC